MSIVGHVESLWRYPVKSMRGEELQQAYVGFGGIYGDRLYAFHSSAAPKDFPYLTGREQEEMLLYRPLFRDVAHMSRPADVAETEALPPGVTPLHTQAAESMLDVETPAGEKLAIDDPKLIENLRKGIRDRHKLTLLRSDRAMTDSSPISLFSIQTARQLCAEVGANLDKRRFRANIYLDLGSASGFAEDQFVGHTLQIGDKVVVAVTDHDQRCKMITLDPDTAQANPEVLRCVARGHDAKAGVYGVVLVEGLIRPGDQLHLLQ